MIARLHVITTDEIAASPAFVQQATDIMSACGPDVALHVRMKRANARSLLEAAARLAPIAQSHGCMLIVNERMDVAAAAGADGVQLTSHSIPVHAAVAMARGGRRLMIGRSVHSAGEAAAACEDGADYVVLGTIWGSGSHPGECGAGVAMISRAAERATCPVIAIGGVTPSRAQEALLAGAYGVAAISGVWSDAAPGLAARKYIEAMRAVT